MSPLVAQLLDDLGKIRLVCRESHLEYLPQAGATYLEVNRDVITSILDCLYIGSDEPQRYALLAQHRELDRSAAGAEFREIAEEALIKADGLGRLLDHGVRVTEDQLLMLMRALAYAKYLHCETADPELRLSPIDHHGLVRVSGNFMSVEVDQLRAVPWHLSEMVYREHKRAILASLLSHGLDLQQKRITRVDRLKTDLDKWSAGIIELLEALAESCIAAVMVVLPLERERFLNTIVSMVNREFVNVIVDLREALDHLAGPDAHAWVEEALEPLREREAAFLSTIRILQPRVAIYEAVQRLYGGTGTREVIMGDKYEVHGQAGVVGPNAQVKNLRLTQVWNELSDHVDLQELSEDLAKLRNAMLATASGPDEKNQIELIAAAEAEARKGNGPQALNFLSNAGKWALDTATTIGAGLAVEVLKKSLGI